jgi:hypothetical protein
MDNDQGGGLFKYILRPIGWILVKLRIVKVSGR